MRGCFKQLAGGQLGLSRLLESVRLGLNNENPIGLAWNLGVCSSQGLIFDSPRCQLQWAGLTS